MSAPAGGGSASTSEAAIWHDVECGAYAADLRVWERLADRCGDPVLELGAGTGRLAIHLARRGHRVIGLDRDAELIAAQRERAAGLPVTPLLADARGFELPEPVALALAPMQLLQMLADRAERLACLASIAAGLRPGGRLAAAIVEGMPEPEEGEPLLPDVREVDGWVYSSLPLEAVVGPEHIHVRRLRQRVSPTGELTDAPDEVTICTLTAEELEAEAAAVGLVPVERLFIEATADHVGSTVVVLAEEE
ncbi:MAG TPA: class I SAM-dependent methyltransferase [Solirubrobacterales bacterium]|nr:class I SAM-dependent methyltransferase [Solirubrobacterales bacterium]